MNAQETTSIRWLLKELHDPFVIFPLQSVARLLSELAANSQESFCGRERPYGVARKYWDVPMEMLHEEIGLLIGSAFVLGQAALTQSIAIITRLHNLSGLKVSIPRRKRDLLEMEAVRDPKTHVSHLVIIDTAANFFKHHHEWPTDWHLPSRAIALTCHPNSRILKQHRLTPKPVHTQQLAQAPCEPHPKGVYSRLLDDEHGNAHSDAVDELPLPGRRPSPCRLCAPA